MNFFDMRRSEIGEYCKSKKLKLDMTQSRDELAAELTAMEKAGKPKAPAKPKTKV